MKLAVYSWFPYQSSDCFTEVIYITLLENWVFSAQGHFTDNTDLFPGKINKRFNGCPMKAVVNLGQSIFSTKFLEHMDLNGNVVRYLEGLEMHLLIIVLQQMDMTFVYVTTV
jgi:hypothetical protein